MSCPDVPRCALFTQLSTRSALAVWQTLFCESGYQRCVRFRLGAAGAAVPVDLLPDGRTHIGRRA